MSPAVVPVTENFVAEIGDIDLSQPVASCDLETINEAFAKYAVLIFPDQRLSQGQRVKLPSRAYLYSILAIGAMTPHDIVKS